MAESSPDDAGEDRGEGRWLSYDQISQIRGIGRESAVKLAQRERWQRQRGNDGTARVLVPPDWLKSARERSPEVSPEPSPELSSAISGLREAIVALGQRAEAAEARADRAETHADQAETLAYAEREARQAAEAARDQAKAIVQQLQQAEAVRKARGRFAAAWEAFRGR